MSDPLNPNFKMPATEARQYLEQASAMAKLGEYQQAIPLYESALSTLERIHGGDQPELAECLQELGDAYEAAYRLSDALRIHTRLLRLGERILGKTNPNIVAMLFKLAQLNEMLGRPDEALDFCGQAMASARQSLPTDDPLSAQIGNSFRYLTGLVEQKRQSEAEAQATAATPQPQWQAEMTMGEITDENNPARIKSRIELETHPYQDANMQQAVRKNSGRMHKLAKSTLIEMNALQDPNAITGEGSLSESLTAPPVVQPQMPTQQQQQEEAKKDEEDNGPNWTLDSTLDSTLEAISSGSYSTVNAEPVKPFEQSSFANKTSPHLLRPETFAQASLDNFSQEIPDKFDLTLPVASPPSFLPNIESAPYSVPEPEPQYTEPQFSQGPNTQSQFALPQSYESYASQSYRGQTPAFQAPAEEAPANLPDDDPLSTNRFKSIEAGFNAAQAAQAVEARQSALAAKFQHDDEGDYQNESNNEAEQYVASHINMSSTTFHDPDAGTIGTAPPPPPAYEPGGEGYNLDDLDSIRTGRHNSKPELYKEFTDEPREMRGARKRISEEDNKRIETIRLLKTFGIPAAALVCILGLLVFIFTAKPQPTAKDNPAASAGNPSLPQGASFGLFRSADGTKEIRLTTSNDAIMINGSNAVQVPYTLIANNWGDMVAATFSAAVEKQIWAEKRDSGLKTPDDIVYYQPDSAEFKVIEKMRKVASAAQAHFMRYGEYPKSVTPDLVSDFAYVDPITGKGLGVVIQPVLSHTADGSDIFTTLQSGLQMGEEQLHTDNTIKCYAAVQSDTEDRLEGVKSTAFFVRGTDRDGTMIASGQPGQCYVVSAAETYVSIPTLVGAKAAPVKAPRAKVRARTVAAKAPAGDKPISTINEATSANSSNTKATLAPVNVGKPDKNTKLWLIANPAWPILLIHHGLPLLFIILAGLIYLKAKMENEALEMLPAADRGLNIWLIAASVMAGLAILTIMAQFVLFA